VVIVVGGDPALGGLGCRMPRLRSRHRLANDFSGRSGVDGGAGRVTAAIDRAANVAASPSFIAVNMAMSPVMSERHAHCTKDLPWCASIHGSHGYVLATDGVLNMRDA
jgi:hypothetical protein